MSEQARDGVTRLFQARSVAVVGASTNPNKLGHEILANLVHGGYEGDIYPVNPKADEILGLRVYPSVNEIPAGLDMAVAAIIISGGFREAGRRDLEEELKAVMAETGLRLLGPAQGDGPAEGERVAFRERKAA